MKAAYLLGIAPLIAVAQSTVSLPGVTVYSSRVANQSPAATFAMPVSALRFEPQVDLQTRNMAEGQADVTLRGGIFENTGIEVGAVTITDPQTGHYFADIPIAPAMLAAPEVTTGAALALGATNATAGAVTYGWRPITTAGAAAVAFGEHGLARGEVYQGLLSNAAIGGGHVGADVAVAQSRSRGPIAFGDHHFDRVDGRLQFTRGASQTDLFAGYQAKFFGWPNLYTPFNSDETENLQTVLLAANHRRDLGGGDFVAAGIYHRRNKDDYAFNRFAPLGAVHPFQHTTWVTGASAELRRDLNAFTLNARAEVLADELRSTSLTFGRFRTRTPGKVALVPEKSWRQDDGGTLTVKAGATFDDTNRDASAVSPVLEIAKLRPGATVQRVYFSVTGTSQVATYTALNSNPAGGLFRGNPNLGRERSDNIEVGASGTLGGWTGQAAVFARRDNGLVDWTFARVTPRARTANAVDLDVAGFELVERRSWSRLDLVLGYTALTKRADYRGAAVDASFYALNYARHRLTAAITARLGGGWEVRMDNVARIQADNLLRNAGGRDAISSSLALAYRPAAVRGFEWFLQADNLWNSAFQEVPGTPAAPRQLSTGVAYAW